MTDTEEELFFYMSTDDLAEQKKQEELWKNGCKDIIDEQSKNEALEIRGFVRELINQVIFDTAVLEGKPH